jgi:hypothetical protein
MPPFFYRDFMEYQEDRFQDYSLLIFEEDKLITVLPANRVGETVYSHQGLTYGGFVYNKQTKLVSLLDVFSAVLLFLNQNGIEKMQIKTIPSIYYTEPSEEIQYAVFLAQASLIRRLDSSYKCNFLIKHIIWCFKIKSFSRTVI